jgi:hypothetical protein
MVEAAILFKLLSTSILDIYKVFEHLGMLSIEILTAVCLTQLYPPYLAQKLVFWVPCGVKMTSFYIMVEATILFKLLPTSILDI